MFCRYCGKELIDEAYVCPACGGLVRPLPRVQTQSAPAQPERKEKLEKLSHIFAKIGMIFNAVAFGMCMLSLICFLGFAYVKGWQTPEEGIAWAFFWLYSWAGAVVVASASCEISTAGFVLGLIQKHNEKVKKFAIGVFVASIILTVVAMFGFIFIFLITENVPIA